MTGKPPKYRIQKEQTLEELAESVNDLIELGYCPLGAPFYWEEKHYRYDIFNYVIQALTLGDITQNQRKLIEAYDDERKTA